MEDISKKLEIMLSKLQKMNINMLGLWFPSLDKEEILKVLRESNKFKFEGDYVRIKTYDEIYEEELKQKLEKIEKSEDETVNTAKTEEPKEVKVVKEQNIKKDSKVRKIDFANEVEAQTIKEEVKVELEKIKEEEEVEEVGVFDITKINGAELEYEDLLRIIDEYNENVNFRLEKFDGNSFEAKTKAIVEFYETKYNLEEEKISDLTLGIVMYSLTNKKKNLEAGYVVVSSMLDDKIVDYMSDNYADEVIYFCPINGVTKDFEFDLNEFFVKDTKKIFTKYLKKCVVSEEKETSLKKVEVVTGV